MPTEVLNDKEIVQLLSGTQKVPENAEDPETAEASVPTSGQMMKTIDFFRRLVGAHGKNRGGAQSACVLRRVCTQC